MTKALISVMFEIVYFPVWWYTVGFFEFLIKIKDFLVNRERSLALFIWIKNIFTPMYAQADFWGRLISFFMRVAQIIYRGVALVFWAFIAFFMVGLWLFLPFFAAWQVIFHLI